MKKKLSLLLTTVLAVSLLAGCGGNNTNNNQGNTGNNTAAEDTTKTPDKEEEPAQGVTDKEIVVGTIGASSGNFAMIGQPMLEGMQAYFDHINANGGVHGKTIKLVAKDDGFQPNVAVQKGEELLNDDKVFAIVGQLGTGPALATVPLFEEAGVPVVYLGTGASQFSKIKKNYFPVQPNYIMEGGLLTSYALNDLGKQTLAVIYQQDDMGKDEMEGIKAQLKKMGKEDALVAEVPYAPTDLDFTSHVQKVAAAKPEAVIIAGQQAAVPLIIKQAGTLGLKAQFLTSYVNADATVTKNAGDAAVGLQVASWVDVTNMEDPIIKEYYDVMAKKLGEGKTPNAFHAAGYCAAQVFVAGLKETEGTLTWENFVKGMEKLNNFDSIGKGITFTPDSRNGIESMYFMEFQADGTFKKVTDWMQAK